MLKLARVFSALAIFSASLTLLGYGAHIYSLTRIRPGFNGMSILTAIVLILLAVGVLATTARRERLRAVAGAISAALILPVLLSYLLTGSDTLSVPLAIQVFGSPPQEVGRTALATAVACLLLAIAILLRRLRPRIADLASGLVAAISATGLLGYLYEVPDLHAFWVFNTMAVHTAISLLLLAIAVIFAAPGVGWSGVITSPTEGGSATRRQLSVLLIPPAMGWLLLNAVNQQKLGTGTAMALMVITMVWPLALLILRDGRTLVALDNARRGRAELQQRHADDLEKKLFDQANELEAASADRQATEAMLSNAQRMETLGQLTGGIAHDFNNLLMAISGNLQLLRRKLPKDMPEHRYVENAMSATDKGAKVTGQLLAFSRSQRLSVGAINVQKSMLNAQALIGNALGPGIHLKLAAEPDLWANSDQDQLELALLNLAVNARDAMPQGGTIELTSEAITLEGQWVEIRLRDTGTGMTPDVLARAAEPFFTTKERGKGTGLGLAQVHGFVLQCGGKLEIESAVGVGTTVHIKLPRAAAPQLQEPPTAPPTAVLPRGERRAIVIDDDEAVRSVVVDALADLGFEVRAADGGEAGLAMLKDFRPDVAVIDFLMPGMNGAEVARAAQKLHHGLPIVFVSGYSDTVALDQIVDAVVLRKPFEITDLERALIAVLDLDFSQGLRFYNSGIALLG
jgi:signal transduction histidine kinase/ActR/RegA family two-component response regulator